MANMPNFLIIGAAKSGTTSLYYYLNQHPQVYMSPVKEPKFFGLEGEKIDYHGPLDNEAFSAVVTDINSYCSLFQGATNEVAIGEGSCSYLYSEKALGRIHRYIPDVKLIAILRNPVDRAYSSFLHVVREGREPFINFAKALEREECRIDNNWELIWHYKRAGFYYTQLKRYFDRFRKEQIKVYLYENLKSDPMGLMKDIFRFLGIDDTFTPDMSKRYLEARYPQNEFFYTLATNAVYGIGPVKSFFNAFMPPRLRQRLEKKLRKLNLKKNMTASPPPLSKEIRKELLELYREDITKLQGLIQQDLSHWLGDKDKSSVAGAEFDLYESGNLSI